MSPSSSPADDFTSGRKILSKKVSVFVGAVAIYELIHTILTYSECRLGTLADDYTVYFNPLVVVITACLAVAWEIKCGCFCVNKNRAELVILPLLAFGLSIANMVKLVQLILKWGNFDDDYYCHDGYSYYWAMTVVQGLSLAAEMILIVAGIFVIKNPRLLAAMETDI